MNRTRNSRAYKVWRIKVLERDGHMCQWGGCGITKKLEVHHIKKFSKAKYYRLSVSNGITLCEKHHKKIYGKEHMYEALFNSIVLQKVIRDAEDIQRNS